MGTESRPGQQITTLSGDTYRLMTKWQRVKGIVWWAIAADGKAHPVELTGEGWVEYD